jgi:hypothetical protein
MKKNIGTGQNSKYRYYIYQHGIYFNNKISSVYANIFSVKDGEIYMLICSDFDNKFP